MARAALALRLLRHRTTAASAAAAPLSAYRCLVISSNSMTTPVAGIIKLASFCRRFSSKAAVNDVIGIDLANTDSGVAVMEGKVPNLASAAEYFFKIGAEGERLLLTERTVFLLMATALNVRIPELPPAGVGDTLPTDLRASQQRIAEITEMIHVASLLHDDVMDDADKRRGVGSLNALMSNKLAVLAGDSLAFSSLFDPRVFKKY